VNGSGPDIGIVVVTYDRPDSLRRLLQSLKHADYRDGDKVPLTVSIDYSGRDHCRRVAEEYEWPHGPFRIIEREKNLGLKAHVLACGDLTSQHDAVIVLEDDLLVSPGFYTYARRAHEFYSAEDRIASIALYSRVYQVFANVRFIPLKDRFDTFFMQVPCSWGQMWTRRQWRLFREHLEENPTVNEADLVPDGVLSWPQSSWMKHFYSYLTATDRLVVYPYDSLTTNMGEPGAHFDARTSCMQAPLVRRVGECRFAPPDHTVAVYDYAYELSGENLTWLTGGEPLELDLYGTKNLEKVRTEWLVSLKPCNRPERTFGHDLRPPENNLFHQIPGTTYSLGRTEDFRQAPVSTELLEIEAGRMPRLVNSARRQGARQVRRTASHRVGRFLSWPVRTIRRLLSNRSEGRN
jgi:hypothetical protein